MQPRRRPPPPRRALLLFRLLLLGLGCLAPTAQAFLLPNPPLLPSSSRPPCATAAPAAASADATAPRAAAAAAAAGGEVEAGLVVLTREEGKNEKLRARLEGMEVSMRRARGLARQIDRQP